MQAYGPRQQPLRGEIFKIFEKVAEPYMGGLDNPLETMSQNFSQGSYHHPPSRKKLLVPPQVALLRKSINLFPPAEMGGEFGTDISKLRTIMFISTFNIHH